jgi:hypothetical protein
MPDVPKFYDHMRGEAIAAGAGECKTIYTPFHLIYPKASLSRSDMHSLIPRQVDKRRTEYPISHLSSYLSHQLNTMRNTRAETGS